MLRAARRLAVGLLAAAVLLLVIGLITARSGDPDLYPPPPGAPATTVFVVSNGYHAGLVLPRGVIAGIAAERGHANLAAVLARFSQHSFVEFGWGDEGFYRHVPTVASITAGLAVRALFHPGNPSVLHVVGLGEGPRVFFAQADVVPVSLSNEGLDRLIAQLEASIARPANGGGLEDLGPGLYGPSLFYRATGTFSLLRVCNHWLADLLDAAGVPTAPVLATLPQGLLLDLRWRSNLTAIASVAPRTQ